MKDSKRIKLAVSIEPSKFRLLNQCAKEEMPDWKDEKETKVQAKKEESRTPKKRTNE